jgi:DnaJ-domain-containing protein 1
MGSRSCVRRLEMGGYFQSANTAQAGYEAAGFGHGEAGNGWGFAEEMRQRMGDEFEPDAQFMEESWTLGLAAAAESWRARRHGGANRERLDQVERERRGQAFREMDNVGARAFAQASEWYAAMRRSGSVAGSEIAERQLVDEDNPAHDRAAWLQQCAEEPFGGWRAREPDADEGPKKNEGMTLGRAMRLLGLTAASTREQVRAAYRRMAGEWHPDRVSGHAEAVRQAATEQMAEINEAYRLLRSAVS